MKRTIPVLLGLVFAGIFAAHSFAAVDPGTGWIQVCKQSAGSPAVVGSFTFAITDTVSGSAHPEGTVTVPVGNCSAPIRVVAGAVSVTEVGSSTTMHRDGSVETGANTSADFQNFITATASATGKAGPVGSFDGKWTWSGNVPASADQSGAVTVTFTDTLVQGTVEICKQTVTGSQLTGTWTYTVTGSNGFTQVTNPVQIGACTQPIAVPAGYVKVVESGDNAENVTSITATHADTSNALQVFDLPSATSVVSVNAGDASKGTIVTYTNNSVRLKLCKIWGSNTPDPAATTGYPFAFAYSGPQGPNTGPASLNLVAGTAAAPNCVLVGGVYRAGTQVVITEGIVPGTKVAALPGGITVNPAGNAVPGTASDANRTIKVTLGAGETVVTFTDVPALKGTLKICKSVTNTPPVIPAGTLFSFTLAPVAPTTGATQTVSVPAGSCVVVGTFAFNSTWTVTEAAATNVNVTAISAIPSFVVVLENGTAVNSNEPVLSATNIATRSTNVTIGENNITELTYTNTDPPSDTSTGGTTGGTTGGSTTTSGGSTTTTGGSTSNNTGGGGGGGGSTASTGGGSSSPSVSTSTAPVTTGAALITAPSTVGTSLGLGSSTSKTSSTAAQLRLKTTLAKLRKELAANKVTLKKLVAQKAAAKTLASKHALAKRIAALQVKDLKLAAQIRILS
jgi:hypothetical protein